MILVVPGQPEITSVALTKYVVAFKVPASLPVYIELLESDPSYQSNVCPVTLPFTVAKATPLGLPGSQYVSGAFSVAVTCGYNLPSVTAMVSAIELQKLSVGCLAITVYVPIGAISTSLEVKSGVVPAPAPMYHSIEYNWPEPVLVAANKLPLSVTQLVKGTADATT